ncbi:MAG: HIT domain-containing protein [Candidatus Korarchaeota archaeon]|nr:HIT domain-containing protein [Candidatus Korarchaeota archaeon]
MPYIKLLATEGEKECIFCTLPAEGRDEENLILHRSEHCFIILNKYPYNPGHLMVAPYRHVASIEDLTEDEAKDMWRLIRLSMLTLRRAMNPEGFNVGANIGKAAGAGFEGHVHIHIVPRWNGDTNFMPVIGNTKVVSDALRNTYTELKKALSEILEELGGP